MQVTVSLVSSGMLGGMGGWVGGMGSCLLGEASGTEFHMAGYRDPCRLSILALCNPFFIEAVHSYVVIVCIFLYSCILSFASEHRGS